MARKKKRPTSRNASKKKRSGGKSAKGAGRGAEAQAAKPAEAAGEAQPGDGSAAEPERDPGPTEDAPGTSSSDAAPAVLGEDDDVPVVDLDADVGDDPIERLIAQTVANALPEEALEPPEPMVDLDAELEGVASGPEGVGVEGDGVAAGEPPPETEPEGAAAAAARAAAAEAVAAERAAAEALPRQAIAAEVARRLVDLGPVSSPEMRDRLLAAALAHAEHKDARYRTPFSTAAAVGRWKALVGTLILLLAGAVALVPPRWARPEPAAPLAAEERAHSLRAALLLQAQQVEAFRVRTQRLPSTLEEVAETLPGVRYVRSGSRAYQLIAYEPNGSAVVYDSTNPGPAFADLAVGWALTEPAP